MAQHIVKQPNGKYAIFSSILDTFIAYDATPDEIRNHFRAIAEENSDRDTERSLKRADELGFSGFTKDMKTVRLIHGDAEAADWLALLAPSCAWVADQSESYTPADLMRHDEAARAISKERGPCSAAGKEQA